MIFARALALVAAMAVVSGSAVIADELPADIAQKLREIGRVVDTTATAPLFAPLQEREPYRGVRVERDIPYGEADQQKLDVFASEEPGSGKAVLVFVHGGAFMRGSKREGASPFYDNIMLWAVRHGMVGVNLNYRLAPLAQYPAAQQDIAAALEWVAAHAAERGGDPRRIVLMGQSAGAVHAATYVAHPEFHRVPGGGVAAGIFVSGLYRLDASTVGAPEKSYFGDDPSTYAERSSLQGLLATKTPFMFAAAALDPPPFVAQYEVLKDALCKSPKGCAPSDLLVGHSHISEVYAINTRYSDLDGRMESFVKSIK